MIKIENVEVIGWEQAIRGMRNPLESWEKSDSGYCLDSLACHSCEENRNDCKKHIDGRDYILGPNDYDLMKRLAKAGTADHRKYMRMITVYLDITAPLYWWKEFDTYKVGTVANSCSTMHKIHAKEFTLEDFSCEHLVDEKDGWIQDKKGQLWWPSSTHMETTINLLNAYRYNYLETKNKSYWWQMIQLLPSSYNQKRTVMLNYEVLANMYKSRKNHKLDEWREFCKWIEELPYSELITGKFDESNYEEDKLDLILKQAKEIDSRIYAYHVTGTRDEYILDLLNDKGGFLYTFDLNRVTLDDALEAIKEFISKASSDGIPDIIQENEKLRERANLQLGC